ncbi:hydrogenase maturation factor [Clostridiales bacterium COT073_COT-073]|nr:hydrogenase maturation factor [Clostridiales bacterium COT073_COT-073]
MREKLLKIGKVSEKLLNRWIFAAGNYQRAEVLQGPALGEDCAAVELAPDEIMILSTDPITATEENIGYLAVHVTLNDLAAAGAEPIGLMVTVLLPPEYPESSLESLLTELRQSMSGQQLAILGGHTEVTDAVNRVIISVTGVGKITREKVLLNKEIKAGDQIVMTKYAGLEGTSILAKAKAEELAKELNADFLKRAADLDQLISVLPESRVAMADARIRLKAMHDVTEGGVLGALWEISGKAGKGLAVDLEKVPILQETIEITEFFDLNPYKLISSGSMLMIAENGELLVRKLVDAGIPAAIIGELTDSKERIVVYAGVRQAILPPEGDELYKIM